ncbi:hypothetical protein GTO27_01965 [Candidatus Bathyarchaeota archaeon]|nr:hypothetical protein [Candidatus Bathyarchaeota archaeon]
MTASSCSQEAIEMYRRISERLTDVSMLGRLKEFFKSRPTLSQLLEWVHDRVQFNKGDILRHNDPFEILAYGQGKCREFSVLFTALCLANSYRARLVLDMSDHVWTEIWNAEQNRWVHVDPSEKRINDPEMYERDWNKNLTEVYAFENGKLEDVTERYKRREQNISRKSLEWSRRS